MTSYRPSLTIVMIDLLFHELLPVVQNLFSGLSFALSYLNESLYKASLYKSYRSSSTFVPVDLLFHELLLFVQKLFSGLFLAIFFL